MTLQTWRASFEEKRISRSGFALHIYEIRARKIIAVGITIGFFISITTIRP
jgi:hypothetical protein